MQDTAGPGAWAPASGSRIAVLAGRDNSQRTAAMVFPLDRRIAHRPAVVGIEVAVTASLVDMLPLPPTAVIVITPSVDFGAVVEDVRTVACGLLGLADVDDPVLTVGVACPAPVAPDTAGDLCLYNLHVDTLPEALVESAATARRGNLTTINGNSVLLLQRFAPPKASAVVHVSPQHGRPVRISGRWGVTETGHGAPPADVFEVAADGAGVRETLAWKPTANMSAHGGTRTVELEMRCRAQRSLSHESVLLLAARARNAAVAAGRPLSLDVAMYSDTPLVLRCRPSEGSF